MTRSGEEQIIQLLTEIRNLMRLRIQEQDKGMVGLANVVNCTHSWITDTGGQHCRYCHERRNLGTVGSGAADF